MEFKKAVEADIYSIMNIIKQAQAYFKDQGIDQWQDNYPNIQTIENDINNNYGYIFIKDHNIIGTAALIFGVDQTYEHIYDGKWISNDKYATIHRMAVDSNFKGQGLSSIIIKNIEEICLTKDVKSIRVDTHRENTSMQRLLRKNEFQYCGIIYVEDGSERLAFEKIL